MQTRRGAQHSRSRLRAVAALILSLGLLCSASPALADEYDDSMSGHPLRMVAYVLHPVGIAIDYLIMRPAHWLVSHEPMRTVFGHDD